MKRILLVEDDERIARTLQRLLEDDGHLIVWTNTEQQALKMLDVRFPDGGTWEAVVTDLHLTPEGAEGLSVAEAARGRDIPVVIVADDPASIRSYGKLFRIPVIDVHGAGEALLSAVAVDGDRPGVAA